MLKLFNSKFIKFAKFAASANGINVQPSVVVVHRNGTSDMFGRFGKHR